jgi:benzodiazapine receptor
MTDDLKEALQLHRWACIQDSEAPRRRNVMLKFSARLAGRDGRLPQVAAWIGAAAAYGAAQGLSAWVARYAQGRGTRPQYEQFERPAFAPPGAVFPVVWSALNLTTATSAWLVWRDGEAGPGASARRREVLEWWALAVIVRSGYVPLAFGSRRLWAATADSALLCVVMVRYASLARRVDQTAAALAVPEIAWAAFATVLSAAVARKNALPARASAGPEDPPRAVHPFTIAVPLRRRTACGAPAR